MNNDEQLVWWLGSRYHMLPSVYSVGFKLQNVSEEESSDSDQNNENNSGSSSSSSER